MDWTHTITIILSFAAFFIYLMTRIDKVSNKIEDLRSDMHEMENRFNKRMDEIEKRFDSKLDEIKDLIAPRKVILFKEPEHEEPKEQ